MDKFSYGLGMGIGQNLLSMGVEGMSVEDFVKGVSDVLAGKKPEMSHAEAQQVVNEHFRKLAEQAYEMNKKGGEEFLAANAKKEGVVTLPSGLQYEVIKEGNGKKPSATDRVKCHYEGTLIDGTVFDENDSTMFVASRVIKGWTEGLGLLGEGGKATLYIPADLAYGARGNQAIAPNSTLIFDVEVLKVGKFVPKENK
jgi:FKBP-type peptidyl-prolyl cis-trans isomerase FklB